MTDRHDEPRDAHDLSDRVSELGETPEDALEEIADRNASLEERLPDEHLAAGAEHLGAGDEHLGAGDEHLGAGDEPQDEAGADAKAADDMPRGEGAPGQG